MNVWEYASRRWNAADILTVLRNLEARVSHLLPEATARQLQDISGAHLYLRKIFIQSSMGITGDLYCLNGHYATKKREYSENELKSIKERLQE